MKTSDLVKYFTEGIEMPPYYRNIVGMEIETMFVNAWGEPISLNISQRIFRSMVNEKDWMVLETKKSRSRELITKLGTSTGDTLSYELGRHNLEVNVHPVLEKAASPQNSGLLKTACGILDELYDTAGIYDAQPFFRPTMAWPKDLLAIPDERDATWLKLDGREALNFLAKTSSVQFMFNVTPEEAIKTLNNLNECRPMFLADAGYPQQRWWNEYIHRSNAGYSTERFGGPRKFADIEDYCRRLADHAVVTTDGLVPFERVKKMDIPLYLRSIWWHFRLRRFGNSLCVEVRPQPRLSDDQFETQMWRAANAMEGRIVTGPAPTKREVGLALLAASNPNRL